MEIKKNKKINRIKIQSNWRLLFVIIILITILIVLIIQIKNNSNKNPIKNESSIIKECLIDSDCMKIDIGCCPCSMGGIEKCANIYEKNEILKQKINCPVNPMCPAMYGCNINSCSCINGECVPN